MNGLKTFKTWPELKFVQKQVSFNVLFKASVRKVASLILILKTTRSFEVSTSRVWRINNNEVISSSDRSIKKSNKSKNFENPKIKTLDASAK